MKGERTLKDNPFRFGGIEHDFDSDAEEWAKNIPAMRRCWSCGGKMQNLRSVNGTLLHTSYPYVAVFKITKGKHKGKNCFKTLCRSCAYAFGRGVKEMDGETYQKPEDFKESKYKKETNYKFEGWEVKLRGNDRGREAEMRGNTNPILRAFIKWCDMLAAGKEADAV